MTLPASRFPSFSVLFLPFSRPAKTADPPPPAAAFQTRLMSRACLVVPLVINLARTVEQREEEEEEGKEELTFALNSIPLSLSFDCRGFLTPRNVVEKEKVERFRCSIHHAHASLTDIAVLPSPSSLPLPPSSPADYIPCSTRSTFPRGLSRERNPRLRRSKPRHASETRPLIVFPLRQRC